MKFEFGFDPLIFHKVMALGLICTFFLRAFRYSFDIWYIALPYQDTDQVRAWYWFIDFSQSYDPMDLEKYHEFCFPHFFLSCFQIFIWYLVHCFAIPRFRSSSSLVLIHWSFTKLLIKISGILSFPHFFPLCFQIFIWYLVHCFTIPTYRSSLSLVLIHWFFTV
jgi:hypothetical protein